MKKRRGSQSRRDGKPREKSMFAFGRTNKGRGRIAFRGGKRKKPFKGIAGSK